MVNSGIYFSHLRELVALELREEQQSYQRSLEAKGASLTGCIQEPACRYPVHLGNNAYNPLGQLTLELRYEVGEDEVELDFEPGKPATVFYLTDGGAKELPHQCYVELVGDGVMTVSLPSKSALQSIKDLAEHHLLGVQLGIDNTSYRVMQEALSEAERKEDEKFVHLRNILIGTALVFQEEVGAHSARKTAVNDVQCVSVAFLVKAQFCQKIIVVQISRVLF